MFAGKKSAQIREILISESAWEEMTCLFAPSLALGVMIYLPFLMAYERTMLKNKVEALVNTLSADNTATTIEDAPELNGLEVLNNKTIILTCNEGMSTSIMAKKMGQYAKEQGYELTIYAVNIGRIEEEYHKADLILLGPQVVYMQDSIIENIHAACPVLPINKQYFSKLDGKSAIEEAANQLAGINGI